LGSGRPRAAGKLQDFPSQYGPPRWCHPHVKAYNTWERMGALARMKTSGPLEAVSLEIFGAVFLAISADTDPREPPRSPGPARDINFHEKSSRQTNSKAEWRRKENPARLLSGTQIPVVQNLLSNH